MGRSVKVLERKRDAVFLKMPHTVKIIKGTLVEVKRVCGKPNCKCKKGDKHICLCLSQYIDGKSKMSYIPKVIEKEVREYVQNYKKIIQCVNELTKTNMEIMKKQS